jgi:hypothetical protein
MGRNMTTTNSTGVPRVAAYLNCPRCGLSIERRARCLTITHCPRCIARTRTPIEMFGSQLPAELLYAYGSLPHADAGSLLACDGASTAAIVGAGWVSAAAWVGGRSRCVGGDGLRGCDDVHWSDDRVDRRVADSRANLDGSRVDQRLIKGAAFPAGLAVEGSKLYWANGTTPPAIVKIIPAPKHHSRPGTANSKVKSAWVADERFATYKCQLDGGRPKACRSPVMYRVALGDHTFSVEAIDQDTAGMSPLYKFQLKPW